MDYVDAIMVIDRNGRIVYSLRFNPRFDKDGCDGDFENIINKHFLEVYPSINPKDSSMIKCMEKGESIYIKQQMFKDYKGRIINSENITIPIIKSGKVLGAIELSKDITKVEENVSTFLDIRNDSQNTSNASANYVFSDIITCNADMIRNIEKAKIIAASSSPVLVYGETGTGKELFVHSIHNHSDRKRKPFVVQNCAALPETLFESILFGSTRGAFTGALDKQGLFEEADGGTLFLDEINSMPLNLQAKLLRVLQDGKVRRLGANKDKEVDVRIVAATNVEPTKAIEQGQLREDLFYRLGIISLRLLPLRKRKEDIMLYVNHFINLYNEKDKRNIQGISDEVKNLFFSYDWPGNVRELQHVIECSSNFSDNDAIEIKHLPVYLCEKLERGNGNNGPCLNDRLDLGEKDNLDSIIEKIEIEMINKALESSGGNISKAASLLKITRQRLHYKLSKYNINVKYR